MKKIVFSVIAACSLFALFGCNHRAETDTVQPAAMEELKPMQQSWRGVLPCADCEGIDTSLFLEKDGTWVMNEHYQDARREPSSFASYGTWARTADKLVLTNSKGEKSYFRAKGDKLEMLDRNGSPIQSPLNYTLEPVKASLPTTPMAMRGMYFYMADAATFTDCATGKRVAVANNAQLERDYAAARGTDTRPVLLVVEGHFTLEANPDTGEMMKTLMTDQAGKFDPAQYHLLPPVISPVTSRVSVDLAGGKASIVSLLRTVLRFVQPHQLTGLKINSQFQMPDILELRFGFKRGDVSFPHVQQIGRTDPRRLRERQRMPGSDKGLADKLRAKPRFLVAACRIAQLRFGQATDALLAKVS